jgi:hypothetical protein
MIVIFNDLQQEIADASNDAARKYYEETEEADRTVPGVTAMMRAAAKAKQQSFKIIVFTPFYRSPNIGATMRSLR